MKTKLFKQGRVTDVTVQLQGIPKGEKKQKRKRKRGNNEDERQFSSALGEECKKLSWMPMRNYSYRAPHDGTSSIPA